MPTKEELEQMDQAQVAKALIEITRPDLKKLSDDTCAECGAPLSVPAAAMKNMRLIADDYRAAYDGRGVVSHYAHTFRGIACNARASRKRAMDKKLVQVTYSAAWHKVFSAAAQVDPAMTPIIYLDVFETVDQHYGIEQRNKISNVVDYAMWVPHRAVDVMRVVEPTDKDFINQRAVAMLLNIDVPELREAIDAQLVLNAFDKE